MVFTPKGDRARWRIVYDLLRSRDVGALITYGELCHALGLNPDQGRSIVHQEVRRAAKELLVQDRRAVRNTRGEGYRIAEPREHLDLARRDQKKSLQHLERGELTVRNVDLSKVEPETRKVFEQVGQAFALQLDFNRRLSTRQAKLEQALESVVQHADEVDRRTADELAEMRARLDQLDKRLQ